MTPSERMAGLLENIILMREALEALEAEKRQLHNLLVPMPFQPEYQLKLAEGTKQALWKRLSTVEKEGHTMDLVIRRLELERRRVMRELS